jgi:hypothetical protein
MKTKLLLFLLSIFSLISYAQITFESRVVIDNRNATNNPRSVFVADIDGDGNNDILSASSDDSKVAWYKNDGQGNFGNQLLISIEGIGASSVFAIDIDGDGDSDVLSASIYDNKIAWYENLDGLGSFGSEQIITTDATNAWSVFATDIDNDGDMDVLSSSGSKIAWYENIDGLGSFGNQNIINADAQTAYSVYAADFDNDGDMDVLSTSFIGGELLWYENLNSQGQFGSKQSIGSGANFRHARAADLDSDGDMDIISASGISGNETLRWYENLDGNGNFGTKEIISTGTSEALYVFAADMDGDGDLDIISGLYSDQNPAIEWHENLDGLGNFGIVHQVNTSSSYAIALYVTDINNDGHPDIISASEDRIGFNKNLDGNGNFGMHQWFTYNVDAPQGIITADIDGDGNLDVISTSYIDGEVAWHRNMDGYGNFDAQKTISQRNYGTKAIAAKDIDADGDLDIVFASQHYIAWHENLNGNGTFGNKKIVMENYSASTPYFDVAAEDMDGDGDIDLVTAAFTGNLSWLENLDGQGNFGPEQIIVNDIYMSPYNIHVGDINNDGKLDIVTASLIDGAANWYENLGNGNFGQPHLITSSYNNNIDFVHAADLDGDNDLDVIITKRWDDQIVWFENTDGLGNFGLENLITSIVDFPLGLYSADVDNDGDMDILATSVNDNKIVWYENVDGIGNFGPQNTIMADAGGANFVIASDLDNDGDMDVIASLNSANEIRWFKNTLILGTNESATLNFSIYPNPTSNTLNITVEKTIQQIELYNNLGQLVTKNIEILNDGNSELDISKLATGVYFVKIKTDDGEIGIERFIKV